MTIAANKMTVLGCVLLLASLPSATAQSQPDDSNSKTVEYKSGQVWTIGQGITVTILAVEDVHRVGKVVHLRIDKTPVQSCGDIHLTRSIT